VWQQVPAVLVPAAYVQALRRAGARVLLLPPERGLTGEDAHDLLSRVDGLVVAGGADVAPERYAAVPHPLSQRPREDRDDAEVALVTAAGAVGLPVLGVCRGMQVLAVAGGGTLDQHLPEVVGHNGHSPAVDGYGTHGVALAEGSWLRTVLGARIDVPTHHHQGVRSHPGLVATGWADDGVVEAVEGPGPHLRIGVQWHPEVDEDPRLFDAFVAALR
jgi:putative glutamine amidotransferase